MYQNLVMSGLTPLGNTNEIKNWDNRPFNGKWPENQRPVRGSELKRAIKKKPKRVRTAYSTNQLRALEKIYSSSKYIDVKRRKQLAETLNIGDKALKIWFQNRRMKEKKESSESSSDTSSETVSCQSPISTNDCVEQNVDVNVPYLNYTESHESQYQFPTFYCPEGLGSNYQNGYSYEYNVACCGVDTSVYPTQYFPIDNQYTNMGVNSYSQAQNAYEMDSWYASLDFNYYPAQQAYS